MCFFKIKKYKNGCASTRTSSKTFETLEIYACNVHFQAQHLLVAWTNGGVEAKLDAAEQARTLAGA
jgi:hypothetical protein